MPSPRPIPPKTETRTAPKPAAKPRVAAIKAPSKFNGQRLMYRTLAAVFAAQIIMFGAATATCLSKENTLEHCPEIGRRFETTFASITATILALLAPQPEL